MSEEIGTMVSYLKNIKVASFGDLKIYSGIWEKCKTKSLCVSIAFSGWGKVSAARATTRLISVNYQNIPIDFVLFTGVAGSANENLNQWDIVVGDCLIQHDMDASPLFDELVIPPLNQKHLIPNEFMLELLYKNLLSNELILNHSKFGTIKKGVIASGDQFISNENKLKEILKKIPSLIAIEMEGAAFAQVAIQENIKWLVIRVISDNAKKGSEEDFSKFVDNYKLCSHELISSILQSFI